jgi:hypothetical protein
MLFDFTSATRIFACVGLGRDLLLRYCKVHLVIQKVTFLYVQ